MESEIFPITKPYLMWAQVSPSLKEDEEAVQHIIRFYEERALDDAREQWPGRDVAVQLRWHRFQPQLPSFENAAEIDTLICMFDITVL